jgi:two-component system NtrC family sensor kinase
MLKRYLKAVNNPRLWAVLIIFAICIVLHYPQQILSIDSPSLFSFLGLTRHAIERILLLLPIGYTSYVFGTKAGFISLAVASVIMFPRVFLISEYFPDALLETIGVILVGVVTNLWFDGYKKEKNQRQQIQSFFQDLKRNEKRLYALNDISVIISQSLELKDVLNAAADNVQQLMDMTVVLIFLLDTDKRELELVTHRGISEETAVGLKGIKIGEGFNGHVARTGEPLLIQDASQDPRLTREVVKRENIKAEIIVPLKAKGHVVGTITGATRDSRQFLSDEVEVLTTIGGQIGMAIENARLYQEERSAAEQAIASEKRYREIFESAHDAIWIHDLDGNLTAVNKASEVLTGYSSKELVNMNVKSFLTEESLVLARQIRHKLLSEEIIEQPYDQRIIKRNGTDVLLKLTTSIVREEGEPKGFQHIARDVTREKEMQDKLGTAYQELSESHQRLKESQEQLIQAEKLTSLGQLAASIAHEVNNPLSGVLLYTQLLAKKVRRDSFSKEVALDYLSKMEAELTRSTKLISNLLDFSRQSTPAITEVNLNDIVNRAFDLAAHLAEMQHIKVIKDLELSLPGLMADADQLQQVFTNLIFNAIQAMPDGGRLTLRTSISIGQFKIDVQDTGYGISPANMRKLFTPFFTTKNEIKGVGLGLAVSYGIIQRHHGRIEVQSQEGEGTIFTVYLPLHSEENKESS